MTVMDDRTTTMNTQQSNHLQSKGARLDIDDDVQENDDDDRQWQRGTLHMGVRWHCRREHWRQQLKNESGERDILRQKLNKIDADESLASLVVTDTSSTAI